MARLLFPDAASIDRVQATANTALLSAAGAQAKVYLDAPGTQLADITNPDGTAVAAPGTLTLDSLSRLPEFLGPVSGAQVLYVRIDGGAPLPVEATLGQRFADQDARVDEALDAFLVTAEANFPAKVKSIALGQEDVLLERTAGTTTFRVAASNKTLFPLNVPANQQRIDPILQIGSNVNGSGGRLDPAKPAMYLQFEDDYDDGTARFAEAHITIVTASGLERRAFFTSIDRVTGRVNQTILTGDQINVLESAGTQIAKFDSGGGTGDVFLNVNSPTPTTRSAGFKIDDADVTKWLFYKPANDAAIYLRDATNSRMHAEFVPGANDSAAQTTLRSKLDVMGALSLKGAVVQVNVGEGEDGEGEAQVSINHHNSQAGILSYKTDGANKWWLYQPGSDPFIYLRDMVNGKMHVTYMPAAGEGNGTTEFNSGVRIIGRVGFYGNTPITKRTATPDASDLATAITLVNALKADLVAYGLKAS